MSSVCNSQYGSAVAPDGAIPHHLPDAAWGSDASAPGGIPWSGTEAVGARVHSGDVGSVGTVSASSHEPAARLLRDRGVAVRALLAMGRAVGAC